MTKVEPLRCPQCGSTECKKGFTRRRGWVRVPDDKIWCFACKRVTNTKSGKVEKHNYSNNRMDDGP